MFSILLIVTSLISEMSPQEMKDTGVAKLSAEEKKALQSWVNKVAQAPKNNKKKNPSLQENLNGGHYIRLSDNSLWEINPPDTPVTQGWITPVDIVVAPSSNPTYPFTLTNSLTGSAVMARKAISLPQANPPTPPAPTGPTGTNGKSGSVMGDGESQINGATGKAQKKPKGPKGTRGPTGPTRPTAPAPGSPQSPTENQLPGQPGMPGTPPDEEGISSQK